MKKAKLNELKSYIEELKIIKKEVQKKETNYITLLWEI